MDAPPDANARGVVEMEVGVVRWDDDCSNGLSEATNGLGSGRAGQDRAGQDRERWETIV